MNQPASLRARKKQQTHDELVLAAVELFAKKGYEATTVDDIAERANYSRATFFRYFPSKEDAVFLGLEERLEKFRRRLAEPLPGEGPWETAEHALSEQIIDTFATAHIVRGSNGKPIDLQRACVNLWLAEPSLARRYTEIIATWETELTRFFRASFDGLDLLEARVLAIIVVGVGRAVVEAHLETQEDVPTLVRRGYAAAEGAHFKATKRRRSAAPPEPAREPRGPKRAAAARASRARS
jgi:AcrR family transcriptional regulator